MLIAAIRKINRASVHYCQGVGNMQNTNAAEIWCGLGLGLGLRLWLESFCSLIPHITFCIPYACSLTFYLYFFFGVDDSIIDDFTQRGDHSSGPMRNPKLTGMVM